MNSLADNKSVGPNLLRCVCLTIVVLSIVGICLFCAPHSEGAISADDTSFTDGDYDCVIIEPNKTAAIDKYNGTEVDLTVPDTVTDGVNVYTVTEIHANAFLNCDFIRNLVIPDVVLKIGPSAFKGCTGITELSIPVEINAVGSNSHPIFEGCDKIGIVTLTKGTEGHGAYYWIGNDPSENNVTFAPWYKSHTVIVEDGVKSIQQCMFYGCPNLESITLANSIEYIGAGVFGQCQKLIFIDLPDNLRSIGEGAFELCENLKGIDIPNGVETLGPAVFYECLSLRTVHLPDSLVSMGPSIFEKCNVLTTIVLPSGLKSVPIDAFSECFNLKSVVLPDGLESIAYYAFYMCMSLESIEIPETVETIGSYVFCGCTKLEFAHLPNALPAIGEGTFYLCTELESVNISDNLKTIGAYAFFHCESLGSITLGKEVVSIGDRAFYGCSKLEKMTLNGKLSELGNSVFEDCIGLKEFAIKGDNKLFSVQDGVLLLDDGKILIQYPNAKTGAYTIPSTVTTVAVGAFEHLTGLTSVTVPKTITMLDFIHFIDCPNLREINIEEGHPTLCSVDGVVFSKDMSVLIRCPEGKTGSVTIDEKTKVIEHMAFLYTNVDTIVIKGLSYIFVCEEAFLKSNPDLKFVSGDKGYDLKVFLDSALQKPATGKELSEGWGGNNLYVEWIELPDNSPREVTEVNGAEVTLLVAIVGICLIIPLMLVRKP